MDLLHPQPEDDALSTYEITATHPDLSGELVVEVVSASERGAIAHVRLCMFHHYRDIRLMEADCRVTRVWPGVWPTGTAGHQSGGRVVRNNPAGS